MKKTSAAAIAFIVLAAMTFMALMWPNWRDPANPGNSAWLAQLAWSIAAVGLVVFLMSVSAGVTKNLLGFLINERNLMSLTRFQTVLWTVIILSAYFVVALARVVMNVPDPLTIKVDPQLWALLGISLTSLVGSSMINSNKTNKKPDNQEITKTANALAANNNLPAAAVAAAAAAPVAANQADPSAKVIFQNKQGTLYANPSMDDAGLSDMFEGDEVGNAAYIDLAKVQMFFFNIIVALSYICLLSKTMAQLAIDPGKVGELPLLSQGMITLLGISHAGHLMGKTADRTKLQGPA
jgi:hypothetical protein